MTDESSKASSDPAPTTIQIGQWPAAGQTFVNDLEDDGAKVLQMLVVAQVSWLGQWWIAWLVGLVCAAVSKSLIQGLDRLVYAGFVAIRIGKQVSDYVQASQSGDESAIDQDADHLIHLGDTT